MKIEIKNYNDMIIMKNKNIKKLVLTSELSIKFFSIKLLI
jgi:hypothetical protein